MRNVLEPRWCGWLVIGLLMALSLMPSMATTAEPLRVIFDTDMDSDNDDVAAAAMLNAMADAGEVEILAMGVVSRCPYSPACLDAINTYYGRSGIPIGVYKGKELGDKSRYAQVVAEKCPHDLGFANQVPDAVEVYRRALAGQPDGTVTMIAVGQMNNLVNLLRSPPDQYSDLPGRELVRQKVGVLFVMAPYFNERNEYQRAYNFSTSPAAAVEFIEQWPATIKFGEGNLGHRHFIGRRLSETPANNPARIAFEAYFDGTAKDRHCADPTTVLYAVYGRRYFGEVGPGACDVRPKDGFTRWDSKTDKQHFYNTQKLPIDELQRVMEELLVRPPKGHASPSTVRVAGIVLKWIRGDKEANFRRAEPMIREAASRGAKIIATTECFLDGYAIKDKSIPLDVYQALGERIPDGPYYRRLAALAAELKIHLVAGMLETDAGRPEPRLYNTAVFIGPDGRLVGKYHKQELGHELVRNTPGHTSDAFDSPFGRLGVMICADRTKPAIVRGFCDQGAGFLLCPSGGMFGPKNNDPIVQSRSRENGRYIIFVHPAEFLVTAPDGSIRDRTILGDRLEITPAECGSAKDQNRVFHFDVPLGGKASTGPESKW